MLREVLNVIREIVPFDIATFGAYADGMHYFRAMVVDPSPKTPWPNRWFEIPDAIIDWIKGDELWVPDLHTFFRGKPGAQQLYEHPVTQEYIHDGIRSFISIPDRQNEQVVTVLSLSSRTPAKYGPRDFERLRQLPIEQAMRMANEAFAQQRRDFIRKTLKSISRARGHRDLATLVATRLATFFKWDHVSILKVNRLRRRFELVAQVDATRGRFCLAPDYEQPLDKGMLGKALATEKMLWIDDTKETPLPHPYIQVCDASRSALCVPVRLDGAIEWMLNVETAESHAFHGPDLDAVSSVLQELSRSLDRNFQSTLTEGVLDLTDQGVVVVDSRGRIRNANRAAERMLGAPRNELQGKLFSSFAPQDDVAVSKILGEESGTTERHITLRMIDGTPRPGIVSLRRPSDEYDHKIWLLTDSEQRDWNYEFRYLREIAHEVAQQTRVPLMIAGTLAEKCRHLLQDDAAKDLLDRAVQHLDKADITYERLVANLENRSRFGSDVPFIDLDERIKSVISEFPAEDRKHIEVEVHGGPSMVRIDVEGIDFVLRSILHYLLRKRPLDRSVVVQERSEGAGVSLSLSIPSAAKSRVVTRPDDALSRLEEDARAMAALNPQAIASIILAHSGRVELPNPNDRLSTLCNLWLPTVHGESGNA